MKPRPNDHRLRAKSIASTSLVLVLSLGTASSKAQDLTDSIAVSFKDQGDRAIDAENYSAAIDAYSKGSRIQHHPVFDFNLARAYQGAGRMAEALDALERFDREAPTELREKVPGYSELLSQLRSSVGELILVGPVREARVSVNGRDLGSFEPGKRLRCDSGSVELSVRADGYEPISQRVTIASRETSQVTLKWTRIDERAKIRLSASVPAAEVWVDERFVGQTPIELKLVPGKHRLRLEHRDRLPLRTEIQTIAREQRAVNLELSKPSPLWTRWWLWTGVAAVATGVVVTGIALSTSKSPRSGDIDPGVVSGPLVYR